MNLNTAGAPAQIFVNPFNFPTSPVVLNSCPCQSTQMIDRQTHSTNSVLFWVVVALLVCCFCLRFGFSSLLAAFLFKFCLLNLCCLRKLKKQAKPTSKFKKTKNERKQQTRRATTTQNRPDLVEWVCRSIFELIDKDNCLILQGLLEN